MARTGSIIIGILAGAVMAQAQGPVAHWSFDTGTTGFFAKDETGLGRDLIAMSAPESLVEGDGVVGKGIHFKAPGFELEVRNSRGAFNFGSLTLEAVVLDPGHTASVIDYTRYEPGIARGYWMGLSPANTFTLNTGNDQLPVKWHETKAAQILVPWKTYHLTAVINDNGLDKVYIDGQESGASPTVAYRPNLDGRMRVGHNFGDGGLRGYLTHGAMDEAKVYDRALSPAEILAAYSQVKPAIDSLNALP